MIKLITWRCDLVSSPLAVSFSWDMGVGWWFVSRREREFHLASCGIGLLRHLLALHSLLKRVVPFRVTRYLQSWGQ